MPIELNDEPSVATTDAIEPQAGNKISKTSTNYYFRMCKAVSNIKNATIHRGILRNLILAEMEFSINH